MKYAKMLGIAAALAMALLAFVGPGSASADVLCTTTTTPCTAIVTSFQVQSHEVTKITTSFKTIECSKSTASRSVTSQGSGKAVEGNVTALTFEECNCEVKVLKSGTFRLTKIGTTDDGTLFGSAQEITASCSTIFGNVHCIYQTNSTHLGVLTGGAPAILDTAWELPRLTTSGLCAEKANLEGGDTVISHSSLYVEPS